MVRRVVYYSSNNDADIREASGEVGSTWEHVSTTQWSIDKIKNVTLMRYFKDVPGTSSCM